MIHSNLFSWVSAILISRALLDSKVGLIGAPELLPKLPFCVVHGMHLLYLPIDLLTCFSYSILPALSLDGILDVSVINGAMNGDLFVEFLESLVRHMNPFPEKNSVLVMDTMKFHHDSRVADLLEERYCISTFDFIAIYPNLSLHAVAYGLFIFPPTVPTITLSKSFFPVSKCGFVATTLKSINQWKAILPLMQQL